MRFPSQAEEQELHERVLRREPWVSEDVFRVFMDPIIKALCKKRSEMHEEARDAAIDAIYSYLGNPERYVARKSRLSSYLTRAAKMNTLDQYRHHEARQRRERKFGEVFVLRAPAPKDRMEIIVETRIILERVEQALLEEKDRIFLGLVLQGERSTRVLAEAMNLPPLSEIERRREVKRNRDRLMKLLERLGKEDRDVKP
ncbi:sigma-70 family RNA polymerase sigma factor [Myxococcus sp. AM011]|uniref:RNA polymerase sigma factor n=1 Tax=Myxococcus sp. AM011 TaxID=2745200 RepID=UPI0015951041|nr:sigma-70 family RNA polymerase sigma factor [Myxococcus sp. AM011]NVJ20596.1 sigma-70 family RNA polymerase sigma factor [Myxococcus sp. AM011]